MIDLSHLPLWAAYVLRVVGTLWLVATAVATVGGAMPDSQVATLNAWSPRVGWFLKACKHFGTDVVPFVQVVGKLLKGSLHALPTVIISMLLLSCSGVQLQGSGGITGTPGGVSWTVAVNIGINVVKDALPVAQAFVDARPDISPVTKVAIDSVLEGSGEALGLAGTALQTYVRAPSIENQCRVHFYLEQAVTGTLQGVQLMRRAGLVVDPALEASIGALGSFTDIFYPNCAGDAGTVHVMAQERVQMAFHAP